MDTNESEFSQEDVLPIAKTAIESALKDTVYNRKKVMDWSNTLVASVLTGLQNLNKPFKYAVTCLIMQKTGAGMTTAAACFWDPTMDGYCTVLWENSTIYCIVTVYGAAISPSAIKVDH
ncbi:light chain dynein [Phytophthora sojae]|uniref:Light chain dynein n=1 Tax=Phytophthora sojae (strain P6497) TaxID=1094619 RepID=G4ZRL9_PHYSP|nr:light chain dynein [Phytophthora sojae]EGZ13828.1 light chain dynein [Phytophthora sojae]|eukprot:XP_009531257.1 light chain dynein [Phytophthora sojae]